MKLTWYGHACFLAETAAGSIVFDPYSPGSVPGLTLPPLKADAVHCSHGHGDHCYTDGVTLSGRTPGFTLRTIPSFHDNRGGVLRGKNRIAIVESEGLRLVHLGDLGHLLSKEQLDEIGRPDVLLIPVGGFYTLSGEEAAEAVRALRPKLAVPMHYRCPGHSFEVISTEEPFLKSLDPSVPVHKLDTLTEPFPTGVALLTPAQA